MSPEPAVVTIKAHSSGQVAIANVMTVINNPEQTTLRTVIASEIKAANPSLGFDDTKHITIVETGEKTDIKQLLDLPMSILLKQQVGIQDGVIHVTVDTPSPTTKPPPRSSSKGYAYINNKNRINPFNDATRENFPPLEEFFRGTTTSNRAKPNPSSRSSSPMNSSSPDSRASLSVYNDFSLDMSIAGQAALAQHRYQIGKYGIDNDKPNNNNDESISPLSDEKDWDHLMDSNESFALTDVNNTLFLSRISESQILSPSNLTEVSDSYFDKSVIEALQTPVKRGEDGAAVKPPMCGVTLSRGNDLYNSDEENSILSPDTSTQVTSASSGLNGIFRAAMKMQHDFDKKASSRVVDENESTVSTSLSMTRQSKKNMSVSFAADESFAFEYQSSTKKKTQRSGDVEFDDFGDFLLSPIDKERKDVTFCVDSSFIAHQPSPPSSCVKDTCLETSSCAESPDASPSCSSTESGGNTQAKRSAHLGSDTPSSEQNNALLRTKSLDECFRRKLLFDSPIRKRAVSEVDAFGPTNPLPSKDVEHLSKNSTKQSCSSAQNKNYDRNDTQSTMPLEESSFISQKGFEMSSTNADRVFGSDAASRLNSQASLNAPISNGTSGNSSESTEKKGGLSSVSKFFAHSFEIIDMACSSGRVSSDNNSY